MRLADCADDVAALLDELGAGKVIAARYSMGGPVAQLLWRRHPDKVAGFLAWAAEEMRRHDVWMLTEAAHSMTRFDSRSWLGDIDVPTAVLRTNRDRVVDPARHTAFVTGISCARLVEHDDGHIGCARATFAAPMLSACRDVAWRANA